MAELFLIRHGQASFGKQDYDALSDLGHEQTRVCGQYLFANELNSAETLEPNNLMFVSGGLNRQKQSMENILLSAPSVFNTEHNKTAKYDVIDGFNEFDHDNVLEVAFKHFGSREAFMANLSKQPDPKKHFHKLYLQAVALWQNNPDDPAYTESFSQFNDRVLSALKSLLVNHKSGQKIILTSSAGPISLCLQQCLGLDGQSAFKLNDVMSNASITRVLFNESGDVSLSYFNGSQYLKAANCKVTYR